MQLVPQSIPRPNVGQRTHQRLLCLLGLFLLALSPMSWASTPASAQTQPQQLGHTPWQMRRVDLPLIDVPQKTPPIIRTSAILDLVNTELRAKIPTQDGSGWTPAPLNAQNQILFDQPSRLKSAECNKKLDFTFFQTTLTIPQGAKLTKASVHIAQVDDYARVYVFNKSNPNGKYYKEYDLLPPKGKQGADFELKTTDFVVGDTNRVVIVQVDHCGAGNNLKDAEIVINGAAVAVVAAPPAPLKLAPWQMIRAKDLAPLAADVPIRTAKVLDQASKTIPAQNAGWQQIQGSKYTTATITVDPKTGQERLKFENRSRLKTGECNKKLDFTYFQTFVTVPQGFTITEAQVIIPIVDDYARVYVYTPAESTAPKFNPAGDIISPNMKKGETPLDISTYLTPGQKSRIVIVHVDHCAPGSTLYNASITVEGR